MLYNVLLDKFSDFIGKDCVIITGGPSLRDVCPEQLNKFCHGKLIISIKQAAKILKEPPHVYLTNQFNYERSFNNFTDGFHIFVTNRHERPKVPNARYDYKLYIDEDYMGTIAENLDFNDYCLHLKDDRPFGPGIIHEVAIFIPVLLKCKSVTFVAWDLGNTENSTITRFYTSTGVIQSIEDFLKNQNMKFYNLIYLRIKNKIKKCQYILGFNVKINEPRVVQEEALMISKSTVNLAEWYESNGIEVKCVSDISLLHKKFTRIEL